MLSPTDKERLFAQAQCKHPGRQIEMLKYYVHGIDAWGWYKVDGRNHKKRAHIKCHAESFNNEVYEEGRPTTRYNAQSVGSNIRMII